jgi:hypothetical protein
MTHYMCVQNTALLETVLFFYGDAFLFGKALKVGLPAGAEVDVESPNSSND